MSQSIAAQFPEIAHRSAAIRGRTDYSHTEWNLFLAAVNEGLRNCSTVIDTSDLLVYVAGICAIPVEVNGRILTEAQRASIIEGFGDISRRRFPVRAA